MLKVIRQLAALVLLLVVPMQTIAAASLSVLQCPPADASAAYFPNSDDGATQERDDAGNKSHDHLFCHQSISGIPVMPAAGVTPDFPVFEISISILPNLFFPEQPQRPPFSARA